MTRRGPLVAAGVAVGAVALAAIAKSWCGIPGQPADLYLRWCYSDIPPLFFAERLDVGAVPYLDHPVEYPVLTGGLMWVAASLSAGVVGFFWATVILLAAAAAATAALLASEVGLRRALVFAAAPTLAISGAVNWDLAAVLLASAALVAHRRAHDLAAGVALGLGTAAKLYPVLLLVPIVLATWRLRGWRRAAAAVGAAAGAWGVVNLPVALVRPEAWARFFRLSTTRPSDWDALTTVSRHLVGWPQLTSTVNTLTAAVFILGAGAMIAVARRRTPPRDWYLVALPVVAWFLVTNKVYSPQFSLWLLPLFAFAWPGVGWFAAFVAADLAVTLTRFPYLAGFVGDGVAGAWPWWPFGSAVVVRAVVLLTAAWFGWRRSVGWRLPATATTTVDVAAAASLEQEPR